MRAVQVAVGHRRCASSLARGPREQQRNRVDSEEKWRGMMGCFLSTACDKIYAEEGGKSNGEREERESEEVLGECLEWRQLQKCY